MAWDAPSTLWGIAKVTGLSTLGYAYVLGLLRLTGNRTLAKLRAFDAVVTIAIGSILASIAVGGSGISLSNGLVAVTTLVLLQGIVAYASVRSDRFSSVVTSPARLLYHDGAYLRAQMRKARVPEGAIRMEMREQGFGSEEDVWLVILESTGDITVIGRENRPSSRAIARSTARDVEGAPPEDR